MYLLLSPNASSDVMCGRYIVLYGNVHLLYSMCFIDLISPELCVFCVRAISIEKNGKKAAIKHECASLQLNTHTHTRARTLRSFHWHCVESIT